MPSFDIASETDLQEVDNALGNVRREIAQRFDFKGSRCSIEREGALLTILADDDQKLKQVHELLRGHLQRRKVDPAALDYGKVEAASGNAVRQVVTVRQGIDQALAKRIVKAVKDAKIKVQVAIQGEELRVSGKKKDDLQAAIQTVKTLDVDLPLQYRNFRD